MRRINPESFRVATRGTSRAINRQIALNLIRTRQPLSRADLARLMGLRRGAVSLLVGELIAGGLVFEGAKGNLPRGRKPKSLFIDSRERCLLAADVRASGTHFMVADLLGRPLGEVVRHPTERDPARFVSTFAGHVAELLAAHAGAGACQGVGVVVPGMVDRTGSRVVFAPQLGWRDVTLREPLAQALGLPVQMANAGRACALAQAWTARGEAAVGDVAFVTVSDGVGVGIITGGEMLQGRHNMAGEFGHVPLSLEGPPCACGARGCWEAYV
jgi:ROK family protein